MEETKIYRKKYINVHRTFLADLCNVLEEKVSSEFKVSPKPYVITYKQQSDFYGKQFTEVESLGNCLKRGKVCYIKSEDLNQL